MDNYKLFVKLNPCGHTQHSVCMNHCKWINPSSMLRNYF